MNATIARFASGFRQLQALLRATFSLPDPEPVDYPFAPTDVAQLQRLTTRPGDACLDTQTWNDLLLERYLAGLSGEVSIFGRQELYRRLCRGLDGGGRAAVRESVQALMAGPEQLAKLHRSLRALRHAEAEVAELLFERECPPEPRWAGRTWPLPLGLMMSLAAVAISPLAWIGVAVVLYLLISVQVRYHDRVQEWSKQLKALQMVLITQAVLGTEPGLAPRGFTREDGAKAGRINRLLARSAATTMVPGYRDYTDWFALSNVNHYFKTSRLVFAERAFLRECLLRCAALEADVALARHLLAEPRHCWADEGDAGALALEHGVHPLLPEAAPLSIALSGQGAFVSGQNGVGKSTFLRMLGLNLVAARAFGFCYAARARLPMLPVYASMQGEDSLLGGESLYMAELRRARELLDSSQGERRGIYLIDEIFRGTNHVESVSAAAAVLDTLAASALVVVSSHNLVLARLLAGRLAAHVIERDSAGTLHVREGVLTRTNGVALLAEQGLPPQVQRKARRVADWLCTHEATAAHADVLLAGGVAAGVTGAPA
jgi:hypothetical protein